MFGELVQLAVVDLDEQPGLFQHGGGEPAGFATSDDHCVGRHGAGEAPGRHGADLGVGQRLASTPRAMQRSSALSSLRLRCAVDR